ncbi:MAG TPA: glycine cleavage T C-terminal barrel domain-containing protein [Gemmatimonadota bacterium]|nr:glycine cleavage T C-terminal barrel domain-containing protein [Gemmatimonadota bacterium]
MAADSSSGKPGVPPGYAALAREAGVFEDETRRVFKVHGERALQALNGLVSADVLAVEGDSAYPTLILTPKGRVLADAVVMRLGGATWLDVPAAAWTELEEHFERYLPPRFAKLEPSELRVLRIRGPLSTEREGADPALASLDGPTYSAKAGTRWDIGEFRGGFAVRPPEGLDLYLPSDQAHGLDLPKVGEAAWEVFRIENGVPVYGRDVTTDNLPQETGLVAERVSFEKGCYTGQEVLARIHYRGKVNRNLLGIRVGGPYVGPPLHPGDELLVEDRVVGSVTSAAESPVHGWIGLAYLRREVEPGDEVIVRPEGRETDIRVYARVVTLPFGT